MQEEHVTSEKIADGAIQPPVITRFGDSVSVLPGFFSNGFAFCLTGEVPVSGGAFVSASGAGQLTITNQAITANISSFCQTLTSKASFVLL
ncbi:MAG: hypothetical protein GEU26_17165 [Nitrososphaeraceae archaeon]|nr:hypothetical protein [Nitrososphaeraceae archaeon]